MQFHLDGFRPGDPELFEPARHADVAARVDRLPDEVDVLIVGCGPAGLTLAAQLAAFPDIRTCIVEQKTERLVLGQADGIACRTMEMFEAFGFSERVLKEAYWVNETSFWKPHDDHPATIVRARKVQDTADGTSAFPHVILNQARVHDFYLDVMRRGPTRLVPAYGRTFEGLGIRAPESGPTDAHPVTVRLQRSIGPHAGTTETVRARYVVGCDGARSGVRKALGRALHGDSANQAWGVMDVLAVTDFPDIRLKAAIHSTSGSVLVIPREGGYLVRVYVELDKLADDERVAERGITVDRLIAAAQRVLRPYTLDVKEVAWWSVYEIGQRLCDRFDDVPDDVPDDDAGRRTPRVFIAGDACHTHSPKAGQGMNVSMQDGFNLGWKLASVIRGQAVPRILDTYSAERHAVAEELIAFDRRFATMFSAPPRHATDVDANAVDPAAFQDYFVRQASFTAGTATRYASSPICALPVHQHLAPGLVIGMRFPPMPVVRLADARPMQLAHAMKADGRWRLVLFAARDDDGSSPSAVRRSCSFLADEEASPIRRYTAVDADIDSVFDVRAVFQRGHRELAVDAMPALLAPRKGRYGLVDYEKVFCPDVRSTDLFDLRGIDRSNGCLVVVRPDQYVANILPLGGHRALAAFFDDFMIATGAPSVV